MPRNHISILNPHQHTKSDITDLEDLANTYASKSHQHTCSEITDLENNYPNVDQMLQGFLAFEQKIVSASDQKYALKTDIPELLGDIGSYEIVILSGGNTTYAAAKTAGKELLISMPYGNNVPVDQTIVKRNGKSMLPKQ